MTTEADETAEMELLELEVKDYLGKLRSGEISTESSYDPLWEKVQRQAIAALRGNPESGPMLYTGILSQSSLIEAIVSAIAHEIATELFPATALKNLFLQLLTPDQDVPAIALDLVAASTRSASVENVMATGK